VIKAVALNLVPLIGPLILAACSAGNESPSVVGILERERVELIAEAQEPIVEIDAREGDTVKAGQILVKLDRRRYQAMLGRARAEVERAQRRLAELVRGPRQETISEARAELKGLNAMLVAQQREYERIRSLAMRKEVSATDLDRASAQRDMALARRDGARAHLQALLKGTTIEELDQARARLSEAEAALRVVKINTDRLTVRAPRDGIIDALPYYVGDRPPAGAPVAVMLAAGAPYARVYIPAPLRPRIHPGTRAAVHIEGMSESFAGRVRFVASEAAFTPYFALTERDRSRLNYLAKIDLIGFETLSLPSGQPVTVHFPSLESR
jgi:HlyD family secretion protein